MKLRAVGYMANEELVNFRKECWKMECKRPGIDVEYLSAAVKLAGFEVEVLPEDIRMEEILALIGNGSVDISVHTIVQSIDRMQLVDFTTPINYILYGFIAKESDELKVQDFIIDSISPEIILLMIVAFTFSPLLMWFFSGYQQNYILWLLHSVRVLLKQDGEIKRRYTTSNSLFTISWIWFCFFFTLFYESAMKSNLLLSTKKGYEFQEINGLIDALDNKGWKLMIQESGWTGNDFCRNKYQCERLKAHEKDAIHVPVDYDLKKIPPKTVMFTGTYSNQLPTDVCYYNKGHRVLFIKDLTLGSGLLAYAVNKNQTFVLDKLNRALAKMQDSYENFARRYSAPYLPYRRIESSNESYALRIAYLWPLFRLCLILLGVSLGLLIGERLMESSFLHIHLLHEECRCEGKDFRHLTRHSFIAGTLKIKRIKKIVERSTI
ncbi:unnamed protein product, partial [Mesorhabditis belari]|uniref:Solute-binding protein family 3/N-terminal domain-containing protein n=1 Tax=Mesorhabditis belari TaxID=2138241 RepID=A0AAF3EM57_9BILA